MAIPSLNRQFLERQIYTALGREGFELSPDRIQTVSDLLDNLLATSKGNVTPDNFKANLGLAFQSLLNGKINPVEGDVSEIVVAITKASQSPDFFDMEASPSAKLDSVVGGVAAVESVMFPPTHEGFATPSGLPAFNLEEGDTPPSTPTLSLIKGSLLSSPDRVTRLRLAQEQKKEESELISFQLWVRVFDEENKDRKSVLDTAVYLANLIESRFDDLKLNAPLNVAYTYVPFVFGLNAALDLLAAQSGPATNDLVQRLALALNQVKEAYKKNVAGYVANAKEAKSVTEELSKIITTKKIHSKNAVQLLSAMPDDFLDKFISLSESGKITTASPLLEAAQSILAERAQTMARIGTDVVRSVTQRWASTHAEVYKAVSQIATHEAPSSLTPLARQMSIDLGHVVVREEKDANGVVIKKIITGVTHQEGQKTTRGFGKYLPGLKISMGIFSGAGQAARVGDIERFDALAASWGRRVFNLAGMKVTVNNHSGGDVDGKFAVAPNHATFLEFPTLFEVLDKLKLRFIAKNGFKKWPLGGPFSVGMGDAMQASGMFFVNRGNSKESIIEMAKAAALLAEPENDKSIVIFPEGSRSKTPRNKKGDLLPPVALSRGALKKGFANMLLDTVKAGNAVEGLPVVISGLGQVLPKEDIKQGPGPVTTNAEVQIDIGEPIDPIAIMAQHPDDRPAQIHAINVLVADNFLRYYEGPVKIWYAHSLDVLTVLLARAQQCEESNKTREQNNLPPKVNYARINLTEAMSYYGVALKNIDEGKTAEALKWCEEKKITLEQLQQIKLWAAENGETPAVSGDARKTKAPKPKGIKKVTSGLEKAASVVGSLWSFPLSSSIYPQEARAYFGAAYLLPKVKALLSGIKIAASIAKGKPLEILPHEKNDSKAKTVKGVINTLGKFFGFLGRTPQIKMPTAMGQVVPDSAKLEAISDETAIQTLEDFISKGQLDAIPDVLVQAIETNYGANQAIAGEYKKYTQAYLNFLIEDTRRSLDLVKQDVEVESSSELTPYLKSLNDSLNSLKWNGEEVDQWTYSAIRDLDEAKKLMVPPQDDQKAIALFEKLDAAEQKLGDLILNGRPVATDSRHQYFHHVYLARQAVAEAHRAYAKQIGSAAGPSTFLFLNWSGRAIPHELLKNTLLSKTIFSDPHEKELIDQIISQHDCLLKSDCKDEAQEVKFGRLMRDLLDRPGNARLIQSQLLPYFSTKQALVKNIGGLMEDIVVAYLEKYNSVPRTKDDGWKKLLEDYLSKLSQYHYLSEKNPSDKMKAFKKVEDSVAKIIGSPDFFNLIEFSKTYLDENRTRVSGLDETLDKNRGYWKKRYQVAEKQKENNEELLPKVADYSLWRQEQFKEFTLRELGLNLEMAKYMMSQALQKAGNDKTIAGFQTIFDNAIKALEKPYAEGKFNNLKPLELLEQQFDKQAENLIQFSNPELRGHHTPPETQGHKVVFNRVLESSVRHVAQAFFAASRAYHFYDSAHAAPEPISYQLGSVFRKLKPVSSFAEHFKKGSDLIRFLVDGTLPLLANAIWNINQGLPYSVGRQNIINWGKWCSFMFHDLKVDDQREGVDLPGEVHLGDFGHNLGWFGDFSATLALSPKDDPYLLIAKGGLDKVLTEPMGSGVRLIASMLPENLSQPEADARIAKVNLEGSSTGLFDRFGGHHAALFGAMTMSLMNLPEIAVLANPEVLLTGEWDTRRDFRGIGRARSASEAVAAVSGSYSRLSHIDYAQFTGGADIGPKPDTIVVINPAKIEARVDRLDVLAIPDGKKIVGETEIPKPWHRRQSYEMKRMVDLRRLQFQASAAKIAGTHHHGTGPVTRPTFMQSLSGRMRSLPGVTRLFAKH